MMKSWMVGGLVSVSLAVCLGASEPGRAVASPNSAPRTARLLERGPFGIGVATLPLVDPTRATPANGSFPGAAVRSLPTELWYPAADPALSDARNAPAASAAGGFPLVVFGHGLGSQRADIAFAARHLASHGYFVASIDFPLSKSSAPGGVSSADVPGQAGDMIFVSQALLSSQARAAWPFLTQIDASRLALMGYSLGGLTAALAGNYPSVDVVAMMAPAACTVFLPGGPGASVQKPQLIISGERDAVTPLAKNALPLYAAGAEPKYLVEIAEGSHAGFLERGPAIEAAFPSVPVDAIVCSALPTNIPTAAACDLCLPSSLVGLQLPSARQQELTKASLLAFFEAYLNSSRKEQVFLRSGLEHENPELTVTYEGPTKNH